MSCSTISDPARREQDRWLSYIGKDATPEERLAFLRYDSHGAQAGIAAGNPILEGKCYADAVFGDGCVGWDIEWLMSVRFTGEWPGGLWVIEDWINRPQFNRLVEAFGTETVRGWVTAWMDAAPGGVAAAKKRQWRFFREWEAGD